VVVVVVLVCLLDNDAVVSFVWGVASDADVLLFFLFFLFLRLLDEEGV